jgi:hypothetical protein
VHKNVEKFPTRMKNCGEKLRKKIYYFKPVDFALEWNQIPRRGETHLEDSGPGERV